MLQAVEDLAVQHAVACSHGRPYNKSRADAGGLTDEFLKASLSAQQSWAAQETKYVGHLRACGWCGRVAFGGQHSMAWRRMIGRGSVSVPPAVLANPGVLFGDPDSPGIAKSGDKYYCCTTCQGTTTRHKYHSATSLLDMQCMHNLYKLDAGE